jgi:MscS family membrane protein
MDFLQENILNNSIQDLLIVAAVIIVVILFKRLLSDYTASLSYMFINRTWKMIDRKQFSVLFLKPLSRFIIVSIAIFSISKLTYPKAWQFKIYKLPFDIILEKIAIILFIYSFFRLLFSVIDFVTLILSQKARLTKDKSDDQLVVFFRDFIKVILGVAAVLLILKAAFNQNIGNLLTGLSIVGAALALSARESLENLIASFIIFFDKPFYVGDTLKVNSVTGTVERIGLRSTRIRTTEKTLVSVPNKQMVDSVVDNWSMRTERRAEIKLEFSEKTKATEALDFLEKTKELMKKKQEEILKFSVFLTDYSKSGITITLEYFTPDFSLVEFNNLKQEINLALMQLMEKENITLASAGNNITIFSPDAETPKSRPII